MFIRSVIIVEKSIGNIAVSSDENKLAFENRAISLEFFICVALL